MNGKNLVRGTDYIPREGSTQVLLLSNFLNTLEEGRHELEVAFIDGVVVMALFQVEKEVIPPTSPTITRTSLPNGMVGQIYNQTVTARGTEPMQWSISRGNLPSGLSLNQVSGVISGTPTTIGAFTFSIRATNEEADYAEREFTITIQANEKRAPKTGDMHYSSIFLYGLLLV